MGILKQDSLSTSPSEKPLQIDDDTLLDDYSLVLETVGDRGRAFELITHAYNNLDASVATLLDNKRERHAGKEKRCSYRSLIGRDPVRRLLLLGEIRTMQQMRERSGYVPTPMEDLRCYVQELVAVSLANNSFYAAVAVTQVLAGYSARESLSIYDSVSNDRSISKTEARVSEKKSVIMNELLKRFGSRLQCRQDKSGRRFVSRAPRGEEATFVAHWLTRFLPLLPSESNVLVFGTPGSGKTHFCNRLFAESEREMTCVRNLFNVPNFNDIATRLDAGLFEDHLQIPIIAGLHPDSHPPDIEHDDKSAKDNSALLQQLRESISKEGSRRRALAPRSLHIEVDGIEYDTMNDPGSSCRILLNSSSRIIKLIADDGHDRSDMAAYVLTFDDDSRTEQWRVDLPGSATMICSINYRSEDVFCEFRYATQETNSEAAIQEAAGLGCHPDDVVTEPLWPMLEDSRRLAITAEIDSCTRVQSRAVHDFLRRADALDIQPDPAPRVYEKHDFISRVAAFAEIVFNLARLAVILVLLALPYLQFVVQPYALRGNKGLLMLQDTTRSLVGELSLAALLSAVALASSWASRKAITLIVSRTADDQTVRLLKMTKFRQSHYERRDLMIRLGSFASATFSLASIPICVALAQRLSHTVPNNKWYGLAAGGLSGAAILSALACISAALAWRFGWSRRLCDRYVSMERQIALWKEQLSHAHPIFLEGFDDWRKFPIASVIWKECLLITKENTVKNRNDVEKWIIDLLSTSGERQGRSKTMAKQFVRCATEDDGLHRLSQMLIKELRLVDKARFALAKVATSPPVRIDN